MKRVFLIFGIFILLLTGCGTEGPVETFSNPTQQETIPAVSWLKDQGMPWDDTGALIEIPLPLPSGLQYSNCVEFDGDLLLWSLDEHFEDCIILELCLVELDSGNVAAQRDIEIKGYAVPQPLDDNVYICDNYGGSVHKLDKNLNVLDQWHIGENEYSWYFGGEDSVFQHINESKLWEYDLSDGTSAPVFEGDPDVKYALPKGESLSLTYYEPDTGREIYAALDLSTGQIVAPDAAARYGSVYLSGESWISERYISQYIFRICIDGMEPVQLEGGGDYLQLLDGQKILVTSGDSQYLHLYDKEGKPISSCRLSENGSYYANELIWNEAQGGYFLILNSFDSTSRLLFWDISSQPDADALDFKPIPKPSEAQATLQQRCEEIGKKYGISILIGEACDTDFSVFTADYITDWDEVRAELDTVEYALSQYPKDFFRQLRYDTIHGIEIQLVSNIQPYEGGGYIDTYAAFVQDEWDRFAVVVDIAMSDETTYYHEFSHVIDRYLEWDSWQREDALFSEETWESYNPGWFEGYTFDYSQRRDHIDYSYFVDSYSTINPTEDRARVMEFAMVEYGIWTFDESPGLRSKLDYYCRCIRDAFDTTGWDDTVLWEQYLNP